jgi:hypothetical protein
MERMDGSNVADPVRKVHPAPKLLVSASLRQSELPPGLP